MYIRLIMFLCSVTYLCIYLVLTVKKSPKSFKFLFLVLSSVFINPYILGVLLLLHILVDVIEIVLIRRA